MRAGEVENVENMAVAPAEKPPERDAHGRFARGHAYKPRRFPRGAAVSDYRSGWCDNVTPQEFSNVVAVVLARALGGDVRAAEIVLDRVLPAVNVNLNLDGDEEYRCSGETPSEHNERMLKILFEGIERQREMQRRLEAPKPAIIDAKTVVNSATDTRGQVSADVTEEAETPHFPGLLPAESAY